MSEMAADRAPRLSILAAYALGKEGGREGKRGEGQLVVWFSSKIEKEGGGGGMNL